MGLKTAHKCVLFSLENLDLVIKHFKSAPPPIRDQWRWCSLEFVPFFGGGTSGSKNHEVNLRFKETRPDNLHNTPKVAWTPGMGVSFWILVSSYLVS